jgi:CRISPR-associated protein Csx17
VLNEIELPGCTPEPLMSYLKALGVFRLVAEQKDPAARLSWRSGIAVLQTTLDREGLVKFFVTEYAPTPVLVPWSGGDFFGVDTMSTFDTLKKAPTATKIIEAFLSTNTERLASYRSCLSTVLNVMSECGIRVKADIEGASKKSLKSRFVDRLRSELPDSVLYWIDAAAQPETDGTTFNPLLGSGGGNDGNTHFSDNFMQSLWDCLPDFDTQRKGQHLSLPSVCHSLFGELDGVLTERTGALYNSGAVGGPNATQGLIRGFQLNPWDFILGIEGVQCFAGGMAKRHGAFSEQAPSFPFLAQMTAAGFASAVVKEYGQHEVWLPTWKKPFTCAEHQQLMREGRVQLGRRPARSGTDFARSVRTLGVSAGIEDFHRYGLIRGRVGGENYFTAASLGLYRVSFDASVTLLDQLDPWLVKFGMLLRDDKTPARYQASFYQLDVAIDEACKSMSGTLLAGVLRQIGRTERTLSSGMAFVNKQRIRPISRLDAQWLKQANDRSVEFRLAASLAGILGTKKNEVGPIRAFLEEVEVTKFVNWNPGSTSAVWSRQPFAQNLAAVFRRRQMEAYRSGIEGVPIHSSCNARIDDVIDFLQGAIDDDKLADLLWGLICVDSPDERLRFDPSSRDIPFEFGLPRLLVNSRCIVANREHWNIDREGDPNATHDPDVFHQLATGRRDAVSECVTRAARRLKSGGLLVAGYRNRRHSGNPINIVSQFDPTRLLASMLFPLSNHDVERIANNVLYPIESEASHVD